MRSPWKAEAARLTMTEREPAPAPSRPQVRRRAPGRYNPEPVDSRATPSARFQRAPKIYSALQDLADPRDAPRTTNKNCAAACRRQPGCPKLLQPRRGFAWFAE